MSPLKPTQQQSQPNDDPPRTGLRSPQNSLFSRLSDVPSKPRSCFRRIGAGLNKKRVVFADTKGLALTAVHLFIPETSSPDSALMMKPAPGQLQGLQSTSDKQQHYKLRLGFPQPKLDFKAFLARLRETCVQLESCNIAERSLTGKVCVSHVSAEKTVHIRVTFDSWRSHHDIPCTFLQQLPLRGSDMDVFAFDLRLPSYIDPRERVEFCVSFSPGPDATPHWDDNQGQNYRVCIEKDGPNATQSDANRFYPSLSKVRPPSWPSHVSLGMQNSAEHSYLQRSLLNSVKTEWKTLCSTK